jgi:hypothetical protein
MKTQTEEIKCVVCQKPCERRINSSSGRATHYFVGKNRVTCSRKCAKIARRNPNKYYGK